MKKLLVLLALIVGPKLAWTAATATPTFTPTQTFTPIPSSYDTSLSRERFYPRYFVTNADGVNVPGLTPVPGAANGWYSQVQNQSCLNMGTGTSTVRFPWEVPANCQGPGGINKIKAYFVASLSLSNVAAASVSICVNAYRQPREGLTSTAAVFLGVTRDARTWTASQPGILRDSAFNRFALPVPAGLTQCAAGDMLNFEVVYSGTVANLIIRAIEMEWNPAYFKSASLPGEGPDLANYLESGRSPIDFVNLLLGKGAYLKDPSKL